MENLKNKNVIISVLAGILIIFGAFFSSKSGDPSKVITGTEVFYNKTSPNELDGGAVFYGDQGNTIESANNINPLSEAKIDPYTNTKPHSGNELIITSDGSRAGDKAYGLELAKILGKYHTVNSINPVNVTNSMYETGDYSNVKKITALKEAYSAEINNLLSIKVPKEISTTHINLLNNLDRMNQLLENMADIGKEQLVAVASARQYAEEMKIQILLFQEINKYFADKNISFGSTEKANVYATIIQ
ncbi:MAG: hypothetical protein AAB965_02940 [Patescibacteria group bacterium]